MKILILFLSLHLLLPFIGLFNFTKAESELVGSVEDELIYKYFVHMIIIYLFVCISYIIIKSKKNYNKVYLNYLIVSKKLNIVIFVLFICIIINLYVFGAYKIIIGDLTRSSFRITLSEFGFFYKFTTLYLPMGLLAYSSYLYSIVKNTNKLRIKLLIIFLLSMMIGILTGFKATAIVIALIGLVYLSHKIKLFHLLILGILFLILMLLSTKYFMNFDDFTSAFRYLIIRATSSSSVGTVAIWNLFPEGGKDSFYSLLYIFGNKVSSFVLNIPSNDPEFLKVNVARYISYLTYPNYEDAISGAFNLTVTGFGYSIYYFGKDFYFIYTLLISFVIASSLVLFHYKNSNPVFNSILVTFLFINILPEVGALHNMFQLTSIIYLIILYLVIKIINSKIIYGKKLYVNN
jgi:hypothetical protein